MRVLSHVPTDERALGELDLRTSLTAYYTWLERQISSRPRQVLVSRKLVAFYTHLAATITVIRRLISEACDCYRWLGRPITRRLK